MTNEKLSYVLRSIKLCDCRYLKDNIYYRIMNIPGYSKCEFLIIADDGIKKAIIYNCGNQDLHWYTFHKWRKQGVLSTALRTGIIKEVWPEIQTITCCYEWNENREEKYSMTKYLASLAGLDLVEGKSCWIEGW